MKKILLGIFVLGTVASACELSLDDHLKKSRVEQIAFATVQERYANGTITRLHMLEAMKDFAKNTYELQGHMIKEHKDVLSPSAIRILKIYEQEAKEHYDEVLKREKEYWEEMR